MESHRNAMANTKIRIVVRKGLHLSPYCCNGLMDPVKQLLGKAELLLVPASIVCCVFLDGVPRGSVIATLVSVFTVVRLAVACSCTYGRDGGSSNVRHSS